MVITRAPNKLGHLNPPKNVAYRLDLLGHPLSLTHVCEILRGEPPGPINASPIEPEAVVLKTFLLM